MHRFLILVLVASCGGGSARVDAAVDAPLAVNCENYCAKIKTSCTGANAQYVDDQHCMAVCTSLTVGATPASDTPGNTLSCREHYALAAVTATGADLANNCMYAGPAGESMSAQPPGHCSGGDLCASFCALEVQACGTVNKPLPGDPKTSNGNSLFQYTTAFACGQACASFDHAHTYSTASVGDSLACRWLAAVDAAVTVTPNAINSCVATGGDAAGPCAGAAAP